MKKKLHGKTKALTRCVSNMGKKFFYEPPEDRARREKRQLIRAGILAGGFLAGGAVAGRILKPVVAREAHRDAVRTAVNKIVAAQRNSRLARATTSAISQKNQIKPASIVANKKARGNWYENRKGQFSPNERRQARKFMGLKKEFQGISGSVQSRTGYRERPWRNVRDAAIGSGALIASAGIGYAGFRGGQAAKHVSVAANKVGAAANDVAAATGALRGKFAKVRAILKKPIRFFELKEFFQSDEAGIPFTGKVAKDRYIKKIRDEDLDRRDANILRAGTAGALAGVISGGSNSKARAIRAVIGAGIGGAGVIGVRAATKQTRDPYGERSREAKRAEGLPAIAGLGAAGIIAARKLRKFRLFSEKRRGVPAFVKAGLSAAMSGAGIGLIPAFRRGTSLRKVLKSTTVGAALGATLGGGGTFIGSKILGEPQRGEGAPITKRAALGGAVGGAVLGAAGVIAGRKFRRPARSLIAASKDWRPARWIRKSPLPVAVGIGAVAGGAVGGAHAADEGQQVDTLNALKKRQFSRKGIKTFGYYNQPREDWSFRRSDGSIGKSRYHARFANPVREAFGVGAPKLLPNPDGSPASISQAQFIHGFYREGKKINKWGGRASRLVGDAGAVLSGQPRQHDTSGRPMKREWEKSWFKNAVGSAAAGAALAGSAIVATKTPWGRNHFIPTLRRGMKAAEKRGFRIFSKRQPRTKFFDEVAEYAGWDVRDPRGRSARVFAPGSRRRMRREAQWHEKKEGQRRIWQAVGALGTIAGLGAGVVIGRKSAGKPIFRASRPIGEKIIPFPTPKKSSN